MKTIKALEVEVSEDTLNELNHIFLGWKFQNEEKTFHVIIDVE